MDLGSPAFRSAAIMHDIPAPRGWPHQQHQGTSFPVPSYYHQQKTPATSLSWPPSPKSIGITSPDAEEISPLPEKRETTTRWGWQLKKVSSLPMFYPIQEWNTLPVEHWSLNTVTARISEFLRLHSIAAEYNDEEGSVRCRATSRVEFVINVWQDRKTPAFLVHIQHISGCSMQLNRLQAKLRRAILSPDMEETSCQKTEHLNGNVGPIFRSIDMNVPREQPGMETMSTEQSPLEFCRGLLSSNQFCERRLGLESLATLTDRSKTTPSAVREASSAVLFDSYFQRMLKSYLTTPASSNDANNDYCGYASGNHVLALHILAQSLQISNSTSSGVTCSGNRFFWEPVLAALFRNIQNTATWPLEACLSIQCFGELNDIARALAPIDAGDLDQYLHSAHQFGMRHNASLEKETRQLLGRLQTTAVQQ